MDHAGFLRTAEVVGDEAEAFPRRILLVGRIERDDDRRAQPLVHRNHQMLGDGVAGERYPLFGDAPKNDPRIGGRVDLRQVENARRKGNGRSHRRLKKRLLGGEVPQDGRRRDMQLGGDVGQRG